MIPFLVILEIIILCLGATVFLYRPEMRVSEAICSGIIVTLLTLSCLYQTVFLIGEPKLAFIFEGIFIIASIILLKRRSNYLRLFWRKIAYFWQNNKIITVLVGITLIYLILQAIILPPTGPDFYSYHLPRVLLFQQEKSLFLENVTTLRQALFPVGWNILNHAFLRFYTDYGLGIFAFLVYIAVGLGTYSLARLVASQKIAIVTTLVITSMPQVVMQSISMNTDIPLAGLAVFCFLTLSRLDQKPNIVDVVLLILGIAFGLSIKLTSLLFFAPFILFGGYLVLKKYGLKPWIKLLVSHWKFLTVLILPVVILSQVWLYIHNNSYWGGWLGPPDYVAHFKQTDGLRGGIANLVRYLFESIDLMQPIDLISDHFWQIKPSVLLTSIYNKFFYPLVGNAGIAEHTHYDEFFIQWRFMEKYAWYGLFGFLLAIPSILFSLLKGKNLVKIVGLILFCFFLLVCYRVSWSPWRGRYFSLFFVSSGICIAYTLEHLSLWLKDKINIRNILFKLITIISLITLFMTVSLNEYRAIINLSKIDIWESSSGKITKELMNRNVWIQNRFGQRRQSKSIAKKLGNLIPSGSKLALLSPQYGTVYHYLLAFPNIKIIPIHTSDYPDLKYRYPDLQKEPTNYQFSNPLKANPDSFDYLFCLDVDCTVENNTLPKVPRQLIWPQKPSKEQLFKLN